MSYWSWSVVLSPVFLPPFFRRHIKHYHVTVQREGGSLMVAYSSRPNFVNVQTDSPATYIRKRGWILSWSWAALSTGLKQWIKLKIAGYRELKGIFCSGKRWCPGHFFQFLVYHVDISRPDWRLQAPLSAKSWGNPTYRKIWKQFYITCSQLLGIRNIIPGGGGVLS